MSLTIEESRKVARALIRAGNAMHKSLDKAVREANNSKADYNNFLLKEWIDSSPSPKVKVYKRRKNKHKWFKLVGYDLTLHLNNLEDADKKLAEMLRRKLLIELLYEKEPHYINSKQCKVWYLIPQRRIKK